MGRFTFHRKFEDSPFLAKNDPKWTFLAKTAKKWGFQQFFRKLRIGISQFFAGSLVSGIKKKLLLWFFEEILNGPFWSKLTEIWLKFGHLARWNRMAKKIFRGEKSTFYPSNPPYALPLPTNFAMLIILYFIITLIEVW